MAEVLNLVIGRFVKSAVLFRWPIDRARWFSPIEYLSLLSREPSAARLGVSIASYISLAKV